MATRKKLSPFEEARQAFLTPDGTPRGLVTGQYALEVIEDLNRCINNRNERIIMQTRKRHYV